jgi:diguanylate cyclase (GGDEF)-like protein
LAQKTLRDLVKVARSPANRRRNRPPGGDEFALLMAGITGKAAGIIAENIRNEFARSSAVTATVSIGVAQLDPHDTPDQFIRRADERLYAAKQKRNAVVAP